MTKLVNCNPNRRSVMAEAYKNRTGVTVMTQETKPAISETPLWIGSALSLLSLFAIVALLNYGCERSHRSRIERQHNNEFRLKVRIVKVYANETGWGNNQTWNTIFEVVDTGERFTRLHTCIGDEGEEIIYTVSHCELSRDTTRKLRAIRATDQRRNRGT